MKDLYRKFVDFIKSYRKESEFKTKMLNFGDNISAGFEFLKEHKKIRYLVIVLSCFIVYGMYLGITRFPAAVSCTYKANIVYSLNSDKWRFNWIPSEFKDQCQRQRANGDWLAMEKVSDVGMSVDEPEEE